MEDGWKEKFRRRFDVDMMRAVVCLVFSERALGEGGMDVFGRD